MDKNCRKILTSTLTVFAVSLATVIGSDQAYAEKPAPVSVVSPVPLPVTGSVTGNVSVSGSVSVSNTPNVFVTNNAASPVMARDVQNPANNPFAKELCLTNIVGACDAIASLPARPSSFVVPAVTDSGAAVKQLVIEFVSGTCGGTARTTFVEISSRPVGALTNPDTGDNFATNRIPVAVSQFLSGAGVNGAQGFSQATKIYIAPGATVRISFDFAQGGEMVCRAQLNGHFVLD
jgi:hypothetical protein